jgi:predicted permease
MAVTPELRQMLRDAATARAHRSWLVRTWHALAERIDIASAEFRVRESRPKGPTMFTDDIRHALRRLRAKPASALLAIGMLALAISVTSTMFTVADHFVIRPAPFKDPDRLARIRMGVPNRESFYLAPGIIKALGDARVFVAVEGIAQQSATFQATAGLEETAGAKVTPGLFGMLGAAPIMGRTFLPDDTDDRVMISERLWRSAFGADPGIVGRSVMISNAPVTVIGVMPAWFAFPYAEAKVWRPIDLTGMAVGRDTVEVFARLAPGISTEEAEAAATRAAESLPSFKPGYHVAVAALTTGLLDAYSRTAIVSLSAGVGLVFLVLCANVANLILARTTQRRVEFGVASALGASRSRLIRQVFIENAVIGLVAIVTGLGIAWLLTQSVLSIVPVSMATRTLNPIGVDLRAVGVASLLGFLATVIAGLPPAWIGTRVNPAESLRLNSRGSTDSRESRRWTRTLLVGEVALATTLLVGAGMLTTSFVRMLQIEPGLDTRSVMTAWVSLPAFNYKDKAAIIPAAENLRAHMAAMPGISAASLSFGMPPGGGALHFGDVKTDTGVTAESQVISSQNLGPDAFDVFGIRLIEGRPFDDGGATDEVIVGRALATQLWPGESAVGHSFTIGNESHRVIGVAGEVQSALSDPSVNIPEFYERYVPGQSRQLMLGLRCAATCPSTEAVRTWLRAGGAGFLINSVDWLQDKYAQQFDKPRAAATLALIFAGLALLASAGGLFSVLTYAVGQRRREFGVRVALGARPAQLQLLVVRDGLAIALAGLAIGASVAWTTSRWMTSLMYGVSPGSALVWVAVISTLLLTAALAAWRPARAASKSDPLALLRDS